MSTASTEPKSQADELIIKVLSPEGDSDSSSDHTAAAVSSDDGSSKEDVPLDDKPVVINIDPSGPKSPSLIALHHLGLHFKSYITLNSLHPYLNKHNLLTSNEDATLMLPTVTDVDKIQQLVSWLPHKGPDFLDRFIECLRDSSATSQGTTAHRELADQLDSVRITAEKKLREFGERTETEATELGNRNGACKLDVKVAPDHTISSALVDPEYMHILQKVPIGGAWQKYFSAKCVIFYSLFVVITVVLTIVTFVLLASLPRFDENKITPLTIHEGMTVELSFDISTKLLEKGSLGIDNDCYGYLYIISGMQCRNLYEDYTSNSTVVVYTLDYYWLLPGSYIEYSLAASASIEIWLFTDESFYTECFDIISQYECFDYPSICYQFQNGNETPVIKTIQVTKPGNYFLCINQFDQQVTLHSRTYDNAKIAEEFESNRVNFDAQSLTQFSFENHFLQYSHSCVLVYVENCIGYIVGQFSGNVSKRNDTVFFGVVVLLPVILLAVLVSIIFVYRKQSITV